MIFDNHCELAGAFRTYFVDYGAMPVALNLECKGFEKKDWQDEIKRSAYWRANEWTPKSLNLEHGTLNKRVGANTLANKTSGLTETL